MLCNMLQYISEDGRIYLIGKSVLHPIRKEVPKMIRVHADHLVQYYEPINDGNDTKFTYFVDINYKGSLPNKLIVNFGSNSFSSNLLNLRKILN